MKGDFSEFKCLEGWHEFEMQNFWKDVIFFTPFFMRKMYYSVQTRRSLISRFPRASVIIIKLLKYMFTLLLLIFTEIPSPWLLITIPPMQLITMKSKERMSHNKLQNGNYKIKRLKVLHVFHSICYLYIKLKRVFASK